MGSNSSNMASPVVISATGKHTATLIFLHGLGDTGHGWASAMATTRPNHVKVICPTANTMPVTLNMGFPMPSWFDLYSLDPTGQEDSEGIGKAVSTVHGLIEAEAKNGIPTERIMLGGFSQGGALALTSALRYSKPLAGVIALSSWLPLNKEYPEAAIGNTSTPVLQCHGKADPVVPFKWGQLSYTVTQKFMNNMVFKSYENMMHCSCDEEMQDVKKFVEDNLPPI